MTWLNETMTTRYRFNVREIQCQSPGSEPEHTPGYGDMHTKQNQAHLQTKV